MASSPPSDHPGIRILLVDDHSLFRRGLKSLIDTEPDLLVCAEATTHQDALAALESSHPDLVKNLSIDKDRIYLTGYSMGGRGTFHLLGREPKLSAAAVPIAGGGNPNDADKFKKVPVWVFHGAKDDVVKPENSQRMVDALKEARGEVKYTEYPDGDHGAKPEYPDKPE